MLVGPLMGIKDPGKVRNWRVAKLQILVKQFVSQQLIHGCTYCSINKTNELHLLMSMCFWIKKESTGRQISSKNTVYGCNKAMYNKAMYNDAIQLSMWCNGCDEDTLYNALFKTCNYGNYAHVHTQLVRDMMSVVHNTMGLVHGIINTTLGLVIFNNPLKRRTPTPPWV